jgi:excisionase family DNA binding protein
MLHSSSLRIASVLVQSGCGTVNWRWNKRAMRRRVRVGNMMQLTPITGSSPASSNVAGMNVWAVVARLEEEIRNGRTEQPAALGDGERAALLALTDDLPRLWNHPAASAETRKRILRAVLKEIIVSVEPDRLHLTLHWQGGDHTRLEVVKNRAGQHRWKTDAATEQLIRELARMLPDQSIASVLNRLGIRSAKGHTWTQLRVRNFRCEHQIAIYREGERAERRELILHEAASRLGVSKMTIVRLIRDGLLPARQICVGAPYVIQEDDLDLPAVRRAIENGRAVSIDTRQETLSFQ